MLIVGFQQIVDFYPNVIADNLNKQGIPAAHATVDLAMLRQRNFTNPSILARMMEQPELRTQLIGALKPRLGDAARIGFPAVLGIDNAMAVKADLEKGLERPIFEIPSLTPSNPGIRLQRMLLRAIKETGNHVYDGMDAQKATSENGRITAVFTEAAARQRRHRFGRYLLATGGLLGGGITTDHEGNVRELVFDLPVVAPDDRKKWFKRDFLDSEGHPIYRAGIRVNEQDPIYSNLYAAGTTLANCEAIRERSFEGIALATGYAVGKQLAAA